MYDVFTTNEISNTFHAQCSEPSSGILEMAFQRFSSKKLIRRLAKCPLMKSCANQFVLDFRFDKDGCSLYIFGIGMGMAYVASTSEKSSPASYLPSRDKTLDVIEVVSVSYSSRYVIFGTCTNTKSFFYRPAIGSCFRGPVLKNM